MKKSLGKFWSYAHEKSRDLSDFVFFSIGKLEMFISDIHHE